MRRPPSLPLGQPEKELSRKQAAQELKLSSQTPSDSDIVFQTDPAVADPKILIATVMWQRPEVFEFWAERMKPLGCDILAVGSEGELSRKLAEKHGCVYLERPNEPLGAKFNARVEYFLDNCQYTHLLLVGSDDLICPRTLSLIEKNIQRYDIVSWMDIYYYEWETGQVAYSAGYTNQRRGEPLAPGRCMSRRVVEHLEGKLWELTLRKSPDKNLWNKLRRFRNQTKLRCKDEDCAIVDIKSAVNINSWAKVLENAAKPSDSINVRRLLKNIRLGENVLIGKNVEIGEGTIIRNNAEIRDNVQIGQNCYIDSGVVITHNVKIGDKVTIGINTVFQHGVKVCDNATIAVLSFVPSDITEPGT